MILTSASNPDECIGHLGGWQRDCATALRPAVLGAWHELEERLKRGYLVYSINGPIRHVRAETNRVLFGCWRGQRLRQMEPRLRPGGKYEGATLELRPETPLARETLAALAKEAVCLDRSVGDPAAVARYGK